MTNAITPDRSFSELYEDALSKFKAVSAVSYLLSIDENTDQVMLDAADHAHNLARDGANLMQELWDRHHADFERKPQADEDERREWTGATAETEEKALAARIFALPDYSVRHLMDFCLNVVTAHRSDRKPDTLSLEEISSMLKRGAGPESVHNFWHLKYKGLATLTEDHKPESDSANDLHEQMIAEIREENPEADEDEVKLRVAIREGTPSMTREEENTAYEWISKALQV